MEKTKVENIVRIEPVVATNVATVCQHLAWATHMRGSDTPALEMEKPVVQAWSYI